LQAIFRSFTVGGKPLNYVSEFNLGHMITDKLSDNSDIKCETRLLFVTTNILLRRYGKCSLVVRPVASYGAGCMGFALRHK